MIPEKDCEEILKGIGEVKMTPQAESMVNQVVTEINDKILYQIREEGIKKGRKEGREEGREDAIIDIASKLKDVLSDEEISMRTGLSLSKVRKL